MDADPECIVFIYLMQASFSVSHMQDWRPWVSQKGTHCPLRHSPFSTHWVLSGIGRLAGHLASCPVQRASCSQVAKLAERHFAPADMKLQPENGFGDSCFLYHLNFVVFSFSYYSYVMCNPACLDPDA